MTDCWQAVKTPAPYLYQIGQCLHNSCRSRFIRERFNQWDFTLCKSLWKRLPTSLFYLRRRACAAAMCLPLGAPHPLEKHIWEWHWRMRSEEESDPVYLFWWYDCWCCWISDHSLVGCEARYRLWHRTALSSSHKAHQIHALSRDLMCSSMNSLVIV